MVLFKKVFLFSHSLLKKLKVIACFFNENMTEIKCQFLYIEVNAHKPFAIVHITYSILNIIYMHILKGDFL